MNFSTMSYTIEDRIAIVTMNRPDKRNALNDVMMRELTDTFLTLGRGTQCRIIILTGGEEVFCAGMDLEYLHQVSLKTHEENVEDARMLVKLLQAMYTLKKPVISMVHGSALGGGCGLAVASDYVFASQETAKFGVPEVKIGFVPAIIFPFLLKRLGEGRAKEFVLQGELINASVAKERGLITGVYENAILKEKVMEFARVFIQSTSGSAVTLTKELIFRMNEMNFKDAIEFGANLNALTRKTEDFKKGIDAFLNKKKLEW